MGKDSTDILRRVSELEQGDSSRDIYDDWSGDYDGHLRDDFGYVSPEVAAREIAQWSGRQDLEIIDFGCGTGLVGEALAGQGFLLVDGIDISAGMLARARSKNVYRQLLCADLTATIPLADASYAAGCCIGSMGAGHIGAEHAAEMLRPIRSGGLLVVILNDKYYRAGDFDGTFRRMEADGLWRIRKLETFNYMSRLERPGWLLTAQRR